MQDISFKIDTFHFREVHPDLFMGTASDRYVGWMDQIYSKDRYKDRITRRKKTVGGNIFIEEILPVDSVKEYFQHFRVLELDFTFYGTLLDKFNKPLQSFHLLDKYRHHLKMEDKLILKVPQVIFAKKLRRGKSYIENKQYLNPEIFLRQFYEPANKLLGPYLVGFIFEQEYQRKQDRVSAEKLAIDLDAFFNAVPKDPRYHLELRTEAFLSNTVFEIFEKHGLGQVLSHWTWLPSLSRQFALSGNTIFNSGRNCIVRLMTPRNVRYEDAYRQAHPFTTLVDGMLDKNHAEKTAEILKAIINMGTHVNLIINNRHGGNAPLTAQRIAKQFLAMIT